MKRTKQSVQMLEMIQQKLTKDESNLQYAIRNADGTKMAIVEPAPKVHPRICILTGCPGEDPDDCTTHDHEGGE